MIIKCHAVPGDLHSPESSASHAENRLLNLDSAPSLETPCSLTARDCMVVHQALNQSAWGLASSKYSPQPFSQNQILPMRDPKISSITSPFHVMSSLYGVAALMRKPILPHSCQALIQKGKLFHSRMVSGKYPARRGS